MPGLIAVVGRQASGKTRLVCDLVRELTGRGYRLGAVKHTHEGFSLDVEGKDSWKHAQAGAETVVMSGPEELAVLRRTPEPALERIRDELLWGCDLVIAEGFRESKAPKIEVLPPGEEPTAPIGDLMALVSEAPSSSAGIPVFRFEQTRELADLLEARLLRRRKSQASLLVDGQAILLTRFPEEFVIATLRGMISSLHEVPAEPREIWLRIRREPEEEEGDGKRHG